MTIVLTKEVDGKKAKLDLISLNGKATVRQNCLAGLKKEGFNQKEIQEMGFDIEPTN